MPSTTAMHSEIHEYRLYGGTGSGCNNTSEISSFAGRNHLGEVFFKAINRVMEATGHIMHGGTIVDATIISAPSSTKNAEKKRDPEMYQTKKEMCCTLQSRTCF